MDVLHLSSCVLWLEQGLLPCALLVYRRNAACAMPRFSHQTCNLSAETKVRRVDKYEDSDDWEDEDESDVSLSNLDLGFGKSKLLQDITCAWCRGACLNARLSAWRRRCTHTNVRLLSACKEHAQPK